MSSTSRTTQSIIPSDKNFSTSTFLSLVHGKSDFNELKKGLEHLNEQLQQQSRRRENLVRTHFGLFVQCADGLEWLKAYRQGSKTAPILPQISSLIVVSWCYLTRY
jgi:hypothetical protein